MQRKRKANIPFIIVLLILFLYAGYLIGGIKTFGDVHLNSMESINQCTENLNYIFMHPFRNWWSDITLPLLLVAGLVWLIAITYYLEGLKNYMHGREHGTAQWADMRKLVKQLEEASKNKVISQNIRMSLDDRKTRLNSNAIVIGGSGAGKSAFYVLPNIYQFNSSYVFTDPKGELLRKTGKVLKKKGYRIKVLNFRNMSQSDGYDPFSYIREEEDIPRLIDNLIANTTPKTKTGGDPFWEKYESLYLQSLLFYTWMEVPSGNMNTVLDLMSKAQCEDGEESELDEIMTDLEIQKGSSHPAVRKYREAVAGAEDTIRSVIVCANSRMAFMDTEKVRGLFEKDEMDFASLGVGPDGNSNIKTALFLVLPALDKTYNPLVGMAYTQLFQELYYQADDVLGTGRLPVPVQIYMDEFANVSQPENFLNVISTCRSYGLSVNVILQNLAQLESQFKDSWKTIVGNCDTFVYLGGNEYDSHEYVSKMLGKWTIDKRSNSRSFGKNGSASRSDDVLGRELLTPQEVRMLKRNECIVLIAAQYPVVDRKYNTFKCKMNRVAGNLGSYCHNKSTEQRETTVIKTDNFTYIGPAGLEYYQTMIKNLNGEAVIYNLTATDLLFYDFNSREANRQLDFGKMQEIIKENQKRIKEMQEQETVQGKEALIEAGIIDYTDSLLDIVSQYDFDDDQMEQIWLGLEHGLTEKQIKDTYLKLEYSSDRMAILRGLIEKEDGKE